MIAPGLLRAVARSQLILALALLPAPLFGQGVTTAALSGLVSAAEGARPAAALILAVHVPSGTQYRAVIRAGGVKFVDFDGTDAPRFNFTGPAETFIDDPSLLSRWRMQVGLRYFIQ